MLVVLEDHFVHVLVQHPKYFMLEIRLVYTYVRDHMCAVLQIVISYQVAHISIESNHLKWSFSCQDRSFPLNKVLHLSTWIIKDVGNSALVVGLLSNQYVRQRHLGSSPYTEVSYNFSRSKFVFAQCCVGRLVILNLCVGCQRTYHARVYLRPHYGNGAFANVYLSTGQHYEVNIAGTPLP